jgi:predicted GNAT family acetyltransferase
MPTHLIVHETAASYLAAAQAWLETQEVEASLVLGVALRIHQQPEVFTPPWYLATLHEDDGHTVGAALCTPPWHLVVHAASGYEATLAEFVAADLLARAFLPTGVNGRTPGSLHFAQHWQRLTGQSHRLSTALRAFVLHDVSWPRPAPGALRPATLADLDIVRAWLNAFDAEAIPAEAGRRTEEGIARAVTQGAITLWEDALDGRMAPVSLVGTARPLLRGITIAPVYTPPALRRRGYAGNAVATRSAQLLAAGWEFVCLFTDLANPTSNKIYQQVGYRPVCDYADYSFDDPLYFA